MVKVEALNVVGVIEIEAEELESIQTLENHYKTKLILNIINNLGDRRESRLSIVD